MNWGDWLILAVILVFALIGLKSGFVYSVFKIASFFISIVLAVKFYPRVSEILMQTSLYDKIKASILKNLFSQNQFLINDGGGQTAAGSVIESLSLPDFLKNTLMVSIPDVSKVMDLEEAADVVSGELSKLVIGLLSLVLLYILIRIGLVLLRFLLQGLARLPVFKQLDKLGGFTLGALEGLLTVYVLFAVLMLFNTTPQFNDIFDVVKDSMFAKHFYENNFIVSWMFM